MLAGALTLCIRRNVEANAARLAEVDFAGVRRKPFPTRSPAKTALPLFPRGEAMLKSLAAVGERRIAPGSTGAAGCPQESSWWFLLDQFFGADPNITAGFITPAEPITSVWRRKSTCA